MRTRYTFILKWRLTHFISDWEADRSRMEADIEADISIQTTDTHEADRYFILDWTDFISDWRLTVRLT